MQTSNLWADAQKLFARVKCCGVATVDVDGTPRISPVGSITLTTEGAGYYFERFPVMMRANLQRDPRLTIMAVESGLGYWVSSLKNGRFSSSPALRLVCRAGERREATEQERRKWQKRVRLFKFFKGHDLLWKDMTHVREFTVIRIEPVSMGRMTA